MNLKSNKKNFYFVMAITLIIMVIVLKDDFLGVVSVLGSVDLKWLLFSGVLMILYWLAESTTYYLIFKVMAKKVKLSFIFKLTIATQFFNGITPFASGGQPFQIYVINKHTGINYSKITSISLQNFIIYQTSLVIYGFLAVFTHFVSKGSVLNTDSRMGLLIFLGFIINFFVIAGLLLISRSTKLSNFLSENVINFLGKIKLVKNVETKRESTNKFLSEFHSEIKNLSSHQKLFGVALLLNLIKLTIFYSLSYVLFLSVGITNISFFAVVLASAYTMLLTSLVPLPGASGGAELGFMAFFGGMISGNLGTAVMLLWRFFTYYMGLALGFLTFTFGFSEKDNL